MHMSPKDKNFKNAELVRVNFRHRVHVFFFQSLNYFEKQIRLSQVMQATYILNKIWKITGER